MSDIQQLVRRFYEEVWNNQDFRVVGELLADEVSFRGSLGSTIQGHTEFLEYVKTVTSALSGYHCQIDDLLSEGSRAAARMTFTGIHTGDFLGHPPTRRQVHWVGAAFFRAKAGRLVDIWVLGDLYSLTALLSEQAKNN